MAAEAGVDQVADWQALGGRLRSGVAAASWGGEEVEIFAVHDDGQLQDRYWDGARWHDWESLGGPFSGEPAASARDADRIDLFAITPDGEVRHRWWNGTEWVPWEAVAGAPRGARAVSCAWVGPRLDVFVRGADDQVWYGRLA